ncbi:protein NONRESPONDING TO OXYLIPINS 2, mitochondrial isoform X2 [Cryptomeria japonica]|uniref:protein NONRESPONDING TO OXYLIPINS 2, mitochondrial isoform X2 n=2 Tax=Cryptomeria japonica TaxID=3369 RepID=UPI0025AD55ED|nr:protein NONRESPONDING TO OXYLIPINS 2, mitochondrial isoform X2 [Cryptomeria japonica]XP_057851388.1 protein NONRESPONDING TO OXYLIPINS 2, mitochondrial isoform X2 [Cryptomeria japonica]XP_057851389.1 protein NONRESPONDING TO OXYLIPINS 2, mitochondrial isoform X2 [Cryptomeria japonica]
MAARCGAFARSAKPAFHSLRAVAEAGGRPTSSAARASFCKNTLGNDSSRFRNSFVSYSRLSAELGCAMSMMPLHNVVATARLTSHLSLNSRNCSALSQGTLCCTSPDR